MSIDTGPDLEILLLSGQIFFLCLCFHLVWLSGLFQLVFPLLLHYIPCFIYWCLFRDVFSPSFSFVLFLLYSIIFFWACCYFCRLVVVCEKLEHFIMVLSAYLHDTVYLGFDMVYLLMGDLGTVPSSLYRSVCKKKVYWICFIEYFLVDLRYEEVDSWSISLPTSDWLTFFREVDADLTKLLLSRSEVVIAMAWRFLFNWNAAWFIDIFNNIEVQSISLLFIADMFEVYVSLRNLLYGDYIWSVRNRMICTQFDFMVLKFHCIMLVFCIFRIFYLF